VGRQTVTDPSRLLETLFEELTALSTIYNPAPPQGGVLYHYTDFSGLQGILQSHKLWATYADGDLRPKHSVSAEPRGTQTFHCRIEFELLAKYQSSGR
jgi:hypothetical protein